MKFMTVKIYFIEISRKLSRQFSPQTFMKLHKLICEAQFQLIVLIGYKTTTLHYITILKHYQDCNYVED